MLTGHMAGGYVSHKLWISCSR